MNYFDHAASSPIHPEVLDVLTHAQREDFANPSAQHIFGYALHEKIENFRTDFLKALGASINDFLIFTSSATESNNTAIQGLSLNEGDVVLYCKADHPSVTAPVEDLIEKKKVELKEILLHADGSIDNEHFVSLLNDKVKLVVLTHVNNQSGVIHNIDSLTKSIKEKSAAHVHIDAVQSFGKINFAVQSNIDSMSFTSHKIGGPKGIAGLFLKNGHKVKPLLLGGGHEHGFRSGTQAYPLIAGFHKAMKISSGDLADSFPKIVDMNEKIKTKISEAISTILFPFKFSSPYIVSFILPGISSDIILRHLETREVFISSTSACSSKITGFNPSLFAMNIPEKFHKNFLRISLGARTTDEEVNALIKEFVSVWDSIKHMQKR